MNKKGNRRLRFADFKRSVRKRTWAHLPLSDALGGEIITSPETTTAQLYSIFFSEFKLQLFSGVQHFHECLETRKFRICLVLLVMQVQC